VTTSERLFHITTAAEFDTARAHGEYRPATFAEEGFIHCSYERQVLATAERIFRGRDGLVLVEIDARRLTCAVIVENLAGGVEGYPHIYGPLPMDAVLAVHPFRRAAGGSFTLPLGVTGRAVSG
jgi:uncharacterized protein (DUF952 family)